MEQTADDSRFEHAATLRDGRTVTIRVMRPDDRDKLVAAFAKLERESVYSRFFSYLKELPQRPLERIDRIDFVRLARPQRCAVRGAQILHRDRPRSAVRRRPAAWDCAGPRPAGARPTPAGSASAAGTRPSSR